MKKTKKKKLIPLTIRREKWARGGKNGDARLLNPQAGTMCCLGFACRAQGISAAKIKGIGEPVDVPHEYTRYSDGAKRLGTLVEKINGEYNNSAYVNAAMTVNDNDEITDKERERKLKPLLKKLGFDVKFIGDANKLTVKPE